MDLEETKLARGYDHLDIASWQITGAEAGGKGIYLTLRKGMRGKRKGEATFDLRYWSFRKDKDTGRELREDGLYCAYTKHLFNMFQIEQLIEAAQTAFARAKEEGLK